jgi:adenine-specific DNA-methyltransferase
MTMQKIEANSPEAQSANILADNLAQLRALFPELITEGTSGPAINIDVLKALIGDQTVTDSDEKYGLNWHGKKKARQIALTPSTGTLRPSRKESVDWDTTQNLMIEGDNLEVLKLLQKSYAGKVKLIYIDPPYNTGKDFVYPDNFQDNIKNYLEITGQTEGGAKITTNTDASGRFHTDWLNMIYPRLKLAKSLLRQDGVMFISIDDGEVSNLRKICDEVFGEENFVSTLIWEKRYSPQNAVQWFSESHDFILAYASNKEIWKPNLLDRSDEMNARYRNLDNDPRGDWKPADATAQAGHGTAAQFYEFTTPSGQKFTPPNGRCWVYTKPRMEEMQKDNRLWFGSSGNGAPSIKRFLSEVKQGVACQTIWKYEDVGHNQEGKKEIKELFPEEVPFDTPKPTRLLERILKLGTEDASNDLILDFFGGSGTTAQAVYSVNNSDNGKRRFILVQLPEATTNSQYVTIAEVTKERIRRAGNLTKANDPLFPGDVGFRVFKLDTSNIRAWNPKSNDLKTSLFDHLEHLEVGRSSDDILYEILLKLGLDLCVPIEKRDIAGKQVNSVGAGVLMTCLVESIKVAEVEALALGMVAWREEQGTVGDTTAVFRDSAFENDVAKSNLAAILEQHGIKQVRSL